MSIKSVRLVLNTYLTVNEFHADMYNVCDNQIYYSTIVSFHQIRSRERAQYATVIH